MQAVDLVCNNKYTIYTKQNYVCMCVKPVVQVIQYTGYLCSHHCKESVLETLHPDSS